ncbi:[acyl-carrier-protein] S-malonyltransferase [Glaciecola punicea ACAM 611]|jgi:[acyl-carrier-protein] S-malonyltransferase|uniref:Malonyl CoA-acyl carrier protein transacylase n=2 Tax=Glaciecola TaxID=89404 RepID=H5T9X1_9ALTE|nr:[acyl-carrier-protein] S-malonyltransferase [Glaciecola punicea ACAM 611]
MLADLASDFSIVKSVFEEASDAIGYNLFKVTQRDDGQLSQTEITQPALLTASVACLRVLQSETDFTPHFYAGHSLGEYTALVAANVLGLSAGVKLVQARGQFMQQAVAPGEGAMYAIIGLDDNIIADVCAKVAADTKQVVAPVNYNSPGQVVIAGTKKAADAAALALKAAGAKKALSLAVSVPSHCLLMKGASIKLQALLNAIVFKQPTTPIVNNVDVAVNDNVDDIKDALVRQLYMPVRWSQSVTYLIAQEVSEFVEVGPGKVLSGLIKRIDKSVTTRNMNSAKDLV